MRHAQLKMARHIALNDTNNEPEADQNKCNEIQTNNETEADQGECNELQINDELEPEPHAIETREVNSHESDQCSTGN